MNSYLKSGISCVKTGGGCGCRPIPNIMNAAPANIPDLEPPEYRPSTRSMSANNPLIYNVPDGKSNKYCLDITDNKNCKCKKLNSGLNSGISRVQTGGGCCCRPMPNMNAAPANVPNLVPPEYRPSTRSMGANNPLIYNVSDGESNKYCLDITDNKDCKCKEMNSCPNSGISRVKTGGGCCCRPMPDMNAAPANVPNLVPPECRPSTRSMGANNPLIYNVSDDKSNKYCLDITDNKDCKCKELNSCPNSGISRVKTGGGCCCRPMPNMNAAPANVPNLVPPEYRPSTRSMGANKPLLIYNISEVKSNKYCLEMTDEKDKDCKCNPKKPAPPCNAYDCDCLQETVNMAARKRHRPYCPLFKHKTACPVNTNLDEAVKIEEDDDEDEALPYGLPPIKLGPCPVMGRPCSAPDGFARMYKTAALARANPSQGETGKVCCSKEFERIKAALKEYMKGEKDDDLRCVNVFNIDTEKRCCDKEQVLLALMGKSCCGTHKLAIQEKFKDARK